jgi:hypothetical protein
MVNERTDNKGDASLRSSIPDEIWHDEKTAKTYGMRGNGKDSSWTKYLGATDAAGSDVELFEGPREIRFTNRLFDSFNRAVEEGRPLVVQFTQDNCTHSHKLAKETMRSPELKELADDAIWVRVNPARDEDDKGNVAALAEKLGITRFPTTVVLSVDSTSLNELGRLVGNFAPEQMAANLKQILPAQEQFSNVA